MRYFLIFVATIMLVFILAYVLFHGGGKPKIPVTTKTLQSYAATDAQVQLTIDGPINADQNHQATVIIVDRNDVTFEHVQGYQGTITNLQTFANNQNAYTNFLFALAHAGFTEGNSKAVVNNDERGYCPQGDRYIFQLTQDNNTLERYWATSCGSPKTYLGSLGLTVSLFQAQVPQYNSLANNIKP